MSGTSSSLTIPLPVLKPARANPPFAIREAMPSFIFLRVTLNQFRHVRI